MRKTLAVLCQSQRGRVKKVIIRSFAKEFIAIVDRCVARTYERKTVSTS
jgi:hypothetical protein